MLASGHLPYRLEGKKVFVAGHRGMVGSALTRRLQREDCELVSADRDRVDLRRQAETEDWFAANRPHLVFMSAAKVGGILANRDYPGEFLYDNLLIEANVIEACRRVGVEKAVFLGSSCIYPKMAPQPIVEDSLLSGPLEPTNEAYAIAKIAGIKLVEAYRRQYGLRYISVQPCNLYGPGDNYDLNTSHVIPALIRKAHDAKASGSPEMVVWGSGSPLREFLHVDDLADALVFLARSYDGSGPINVGSGQEVSIAGLAEIVAREVGFDGTFTFDRSKPDGTPRKVLDLGRLHALGWNHSIDLVAGVRSAYQWFLSRRSVPESEVA
jgi:GDP-L-fucose synthase